VANTEQRRIPAVVVGLIVASILTGMWLLATVPNQPPCDGALCGLVQGWPWGIAVIGWPAVFLVTWFIAWKPLQRESPNADES
jgi:hypothetical protein